MMLARALRIYERDKHQVLRELLGPGATFVDIGANKGDFALFAARLVGESGRVVAIEPEKQNCEWIRRSIELNGYRNIDLVEAAVGSQEGVADLHLSDVTSWHTLVERPPFTSPASEPVRVRTLDTVLTELGVHAVDALKLDVEGWEMEVLEGAEETLDVTRLRVLAIEIHPSHGVDPVRLGRLVEAKGFELRSPSDPSTPVSVNPATGEVLALR
jgi:FkbM family methyltransferase